MDSPKTHRFGRSRAAALAALVCAAALLAALLPPIAAASSGAIPASALTDDLKLGNTVSGQAVLAPVVAPPAVLGAAGTLPAATEPAAFAAGSVAVSIIFPQSTGASSSESWATTDSYGTPGLTNTAYPGLTPRQVYIVGEIQKALDWWAAQAPAAARLSFVIPPAGTLGAPRQRGVAREPIKIASTNDALWRHPVMNPILRKLGLPVASATDSPPPETAYDNAVRKANHTDWAFTVYVVDSLHDDAAATHDPTPGLFPNKQFAYTFALFGPYSVLTYDTAFGPANFDGVLAHEMGHVFGALDEYAAPPGYPSSGGLYSGYLWVRNGNAVQGGTTDDACIMRGGQEGLDAYHQSSTLADGGICLSTRGQVGWRATRDGLPDVVDTAPAVSVKPPVSATSASSLTIGGSAREVAWPPGHNAKGRAFAKGISIFVPHDLQYTVDGGSPVAVAAAGSGATKTFGFTLDTSMLGVADPQAPTRHVVAVQATTGTTATKNVVAWGASTPVTLTLTRAAATIALGAKATLTVHAADTDDTVYPIGHLAGIAVVARSGAATSRKTVTSGTAGSAAVTFAPSFTSTYTAAFTPGPESLEFLAATSDPVTVAVRARLAASAGAPSASGVVRVSGTFRPRRAGVALVLQARRSGVWTTVAHTHTTARATFAFAYAAPTGALHLRVRFAGDARNAAALRALPAITVP